MVVADLPKISGGQDCMFHHAGAVLADCSLY